MLYFVGVWTYQTRQEAEEIAEKINSQARRGLRDFVEVIEVPEPEKVVTMSKPRYNSDEPIRRTFYVYPDGSSVEIYRDGIGEKNPSWKNLRIVMVDIGGYKVEEEVTESWWNE